MSRPTRRAATALASTASAVVDVFLAVVSTAVAVGLFFDAANGALGTPVATETVGSAATLAGLAAVYPFVSGRWSLDRFLEFVFTAVAGFFAVAVLLSVPLYFRFGVRAGDDIAPALQFVYVTVAYVVAAVDVYYRPFLRI